MSLRNALSAKNLKKILSDASRETGTFAQAITSPLQGLLSPARDLGVLGAGAALGETEGVGALEGIKAAGKVIPRMNFATNATNSLVNQGIIPKLAGDAGTTGGELLGALATPGLGAVKVLDGARVMLPKLARYSALRGAEGGVFGGMHELAESGDRVEATKQAGIGALIAALGNVGMSPKLAKAAYVDTRERSALSNALNLVNKPYDSRDFTGRVLRNERGGFIQGSKPVKINDYSFARHDEMSNTDALDFLKGRNPNKPRIKLYGESDNIPEGTTTMVYDDARNKLKSILADPDFLKLLEREARNGI